MNATELLALLALNHRSELHAGAEHDAVHRAGGQLWLEAGNDVCLRRACGLGIAL